MFLSFFFGIILCWHVVQQLQHNVRYVVVVVVPSLSLPSSALHHPPQHNAATELGLLLVTSFDENNRECDETRLKQLKRVAEAMTPGVEMSEYLKRAIRYCCSEGFAV